MIGLGLILAAAGIIMLIITAAQALTNRYYSTGTQNIIGTVIRKRSRRLKNGTSYELTVSYMIEGTAYERIVNASLTEFGTIHEGDKLELLYKVSNPKRAVRPMELKPRNVQILLLISVILIVTGVVLFIIGRM